MRVDSLKRVRLCWCVTWPLCGRSCGRCRSTRESGSISQLSLQSKFLPFFRERYSPPNPVSASIGRNPGDVIWSILRHTVTKLGWNVFLSLVHENMLNRIDPIHLECIRLCFLPMVQCHLDTFKDTWNHHRMRVNRRNDKLSAIPNNLFILCPCVME